jgi:hypothetical protein
MRGLTILALLVVGMASGCGLPSYQPPPVDGSACPAAEARLRELECRRPDGSPWWQTPKGTPFGAACARAAQDGRGWRADCLIVIRDCGGIEAAYRAPVGSACP